ncbi:Tig FKBP-type peptidyl-prolyl cis-trans isomerase (trigger factor) [Rhabdaerophilaceae bacterium]
MQLTQTLTDGLKRQYNVVISATDLAARFNTELETIRGKVQLNGFRPGKVPTAHLKKVYGRSIMAEVVQNSVSEAQKKIVDEAGARLAGEPKVVLPEDENTINSVLAGNGDLGFSIDVELLPKFDIVDHSHLELVRQVVAVTETEIDETIGRMAKSSRPFSPRDAGEIAHDGDKVTIDFLGTINGIPFDGGAAKGMDLVLGSGQFIPGFEDQLIGLKAGDDKTVQVTFPDTYQVVDLAGKPAEFAVTVHAIQAPGDAVLDDEFAKKFGVDSIEKLREAIKSSMEAEMADHARQKVKRQLLDGLDTLYTFDLPQTMLEQEFAVVWNQVVADMQREGKSFEGNPEAEAETRAEYQKISERRVRLGLVLAEIGEKAEIKISDDEVTRALVQRAREFPGQEKQFFEYYRKNPQALADIRAPLFEEKVVDYILTGVKVTEKSVTRDELFASDEPEEELGDTAEAKAEKPKKTKAKKTE